jgi:uncharacterized membrane protein
MTHEECQICNSLDTMPQDKILSTDVHAHGPRTSGRSAEAQSNSGSKRRVGIQVIAPRYCTKISVVICIVCLAGPDHSRPTVWPVWAWNNRKITTDLRAGGAMAFCGNCGAAVNAGMSFCGSCGAPVAATPAGVQPPASSPAYQAPAGSPITPPPQAAPLPASTPMASNIAGMLTYVLGFITGIIFLVIEPYKHDPFVRFHAFQSILYSAVAIGFSIVWTIIDGLLFAMTYGLWHIMLLLWILVRLGFFLLWLFLLFKAYNNERFMLPIIGPIAAKQAG